jgi:hypothetical protein
MFVAFCINAEGSDQHQVVADVQPVDLDDQEVQARIAEIMRAGAERAEITVEQVLRELAKIGFSDIRKAVAWRNEMVAREDEEEGKGEDGVVRVTRVLLPRVSIVPSEEMDPLLN